MLLSMLSSFFILKTFHQTTLCRQAQKQKKKQPHSLGKGLFSVFLKIKIRSLFFTKSVFDRKDYFGAVFDVFDVPQNVRCKKDG